MNGLKFGSDGKYSSGYPALDKLIAKIIKNNTTDDMTQKERFEALYKYVMKNFKYRLVPYVATNAVNWEPQYAYNALSQNQGNCYSYAASVTMLARACGYKAVGVSGAFTSSYHSSWVMHGWCQVTVDGTVYVCDAELQSVYAKNRNYYWWDMFFKTKSQITAITTVRYSK